MDAYRRLRETPHATVAVAGLLTPFLFTGYLVTFLRIWQHPVSSGPIDVSMQTAIVLLALVGIGLAVGTAWAQGFRISPLLVIGLTLPWPMIFSSHPFRGYAGASYVYLLFVVVYGLIGTEAALRSDVQSSEVLQTKLGQYALAFGMAHFLLGFGILIYARGFYLLSGVAIVFVIASGVGLFLLGAVPVFLWWRRRILSPGLLVAGWSIWGVYGIWQIAHMLPYGPFNGIGFSRLQPYPDYMATWVPLAVLMLFFGLGEGAIRNWWATQGREPAEG